MKNAHEYTGLYEDLGVDLRELGCLMLDVESPWINLPTELEALQYFSPDPKQFWIKGVLKDWHVTARYGFLPNVKKRHVESVIEGLRWPETLWTGSIEVFPSPYPDQPYDCYVLRLEDTWLYEVNEQLSVLPNLNTFPEYKPHVTLGYFEAGHSDELHELFYDNVKEELVPIEWNYGHILTKE